MGSHIQGEPSSVCPCRSGAGGRGSPTHPAEPARTAKHLPLLQLAKLPGSRPVSLFPASSCRGTPPTQQWHKPLRRKTEAPTWPADGPSWLCTLQSPHQPQYCPVDTPATLNLCTHPTPTKPRAQVAMAFSGPCSKALQGTWYTVPICCILSHCAFCGPPERGGCFVLVTAAAPETTTYLEWGRY